MSIITIDDVPAEALRQVEQELARRNPGKPVHVTIVDDEPVEGKPKTFMEAARRATREARTNGLTYEKLQEILAEDD
ncbi:hypothetical protein [Endothiovibrio diazotrophicus]